MDRPCRQLRSVGRFPTAAGGLIAADRDSLAASDFPVEFDLYSPEADEPSFIVTGTCMWTVPEVRDLWRTEVTLTGGGRWQITAHSPGCSGFQNRKLIRSE